MQFKDYYATLGLEHSATHDEIKRAYRKLARKHHPDVSREPGAEDRFKEVAEAHEALIDPERRAAYDALAERHAAGQSFEPPPGWDGGHNFGHQGAPGGGDFGDFFESLFARDRAGRAGPQRGDDQHARLQIDLLDSYQGARRTVSLRVQAVDAHGRRVLQHRQLEVQIPKGVREGQQLRLAGQGGPGVGDAPAGDLYLEVSLNPHPRFRVDGRDVYTDLALAPWEAALGATVTAPTPEGEVQLTVPAGSHQGRQLRLKGRGLPGQPPGDLYAVLGIVLPPAVTQAEQDAYGAWSQAFAGFKPRETAKP